MVARGLGIDQPEEDLALAVGRVEEVLDLQAGVAVDAGRVVGEVVEVGDDIVGDAGRDDDETAVYLLAVLDGVDVEAGHDAEVVVAALEGLEEVAIARGVGVDDLARGQDDLVVAHAIG